MKARENLDPAVVPVTAWATYINDRTPRGTRKGAQMVSRAHRPAVADVMVRIERTR